ncbi:MAG TPA: DGQHR domain-containing protein [Planctomycetota bacterium]|jgi:DGQHR domain-containing protein
MSNTKQVKTKAVVALKVRQWLQEWDEIKFDEDAQQAKPLEYFYLCKMRAGDLKALTGVYRRSAKHGTPRAKDPNVQRGHEEDRSITIREFVKHGFPWCEMGDAKRSTPGANELLKPGWLPTAIIVNILEKGASRNSETIPSDDLVQVAEEGDITKLLLPKDFDGSKWQPKKVYPLEVIDGQHRLWAFEDFDPAEDFELPVVAFHGLDRSWQAYLFWSVNITPKRINRSLAFDLYPLLRREDWLDRFTGHSIYRETRCQELVESFWSHPDSPWYQRINMLGETAQQRGNEIPMVTQAAWIRSLMATFVKEWNDGGKIGGLFGAARGSHSTLLPWNRAMQAGFLIFAGASFQKAVKACKDQWAEKLRKQKDDTLFETGDDPAFHGRYSLITTDQGIRGLLSIFNDLCFAISEDLGLNEWLWEDIAGKQKANLPPATDEASVTLAVQSLKRTKIGAFIETVGKALASYDWRTSSTPGLSDQERLKQAVFRGSSGYKELRQQLISHLKKGPVQLAKAATAADNLRK